MRHDFVGWSRQGVIVMPELTKIKTNFFKYSYEIPTGQLIK